MSQASPRISAEQDKIHSYLNTTYSGYRLERDRVGESILWLKNCEELPVLIEALRDPAGLAMDRLSDLTAYDNIDKKDGPKRFVMVYQLYSMRTNGRLRLKINLNEDESVPSLTGFWKAANWLEREVYDMFGLSFAGHPDLRRILMDERFVGYPLRKEYDIKERQPFPDSLPVRVVAPQLAIDRPEDQKI